MNDQSATKSRKLLDQIRDAIRLKHYSCSTEKTYVHLAKQYILFHNKTHQPRWLLKLPKCRGRAIPGACIPIFFKNNVSLYATKKIIYY